MAKRLSNHAMEGSTYVVRLSFFDEDGVAEVPTTATWTLTDPAGTVINTRLDIAIAAPATTNDIVLSGADLTIGVNGPERVLMVEATYTSGLGVGLPLRDECWFVIDGLVAYP